MKRILISLCLSLALFKGYAQTDDLPVQIAKSEFQAKQVIPPSPIAAELGKYGNVPISLFTGTPNISIPLYELKGTLLSLPISLSYNASGFKPEDMAPWVGSGWSLNAGGVITRAVLGNPDMNDNYFNATTSPGPLNPPDPLSIFPFYNYVDRLHDYHLESQPDIYYYNFGGYTGKFVLKPDQTVIKKRKDMLKIVSNILGTSGSSFTVTDEHGNVYTFSDVEMTRMQPSDDLGAPVVPPYVYPSAWYLTQIQSADQSEQINFEYYSTTAEQSIYPNNLKNESVYMTYDLLNYPGTGGCPYTYLQGNPISTSPTTNIKRKFLKKITLVKNGGTTYVDLTSSAGTRQDSDFPEDRLLDKVTIYDSFNGWGNAKKVKQFNLTHGYFFNSANILTEKYRLRLDAVQEMRLDSVTPAKPPYTFEYDGTALPTRFTKSLDHWGFYNASGNTSLIPSIQISVPVQFGGTLYMGKNANREASLAGSAATILKKIKYPTGGYTVFDYELNATNNDLGNLQEVGGLRVLTATDYSFTDKKAIVKSYNYTLDDGTSSGQTTFPQYLKQTQQTLYAGAGACLKQLVTATVSASSIFGLGSMNGGHIGYSQVTETQTELSTGKPLGKTIYKYNIGYFGPYDADISNGDLTEKTVYNSDGKLLKSVASTYQYGTTDYVNGYIPRPTGTQTNRIEYYLLTDGTYQNKQNWEPAPPNVVSSREIPVTFYLEQTIFNGQSSQLVQQTEKNYDQGGNNYQTFVKNYAYGNPLHIFPTQIVENTTNNKQVVTLKKYAGDYPFTGPTSNIPAAAIVSLKNKNMLGTEVETIQYRQNPDGTNKKYINGSLITYTTTPVPTPEKVYRIESVVPLTAVAQSTISGSGVFTNDANYKLAGSFKYNNNNLIEQSKASGVVSSFIWDYYGMRPVASVTNTSSDYVAYTGFEGGVATNNWVPYHVLLDTTSAFTGTISGVLDGTSKITRVFTAAAPALVVSYWASGAAAVKMNTSVTVPVTLQGTSIKGWTYYEHLLPAGATTVELTGTGIHIDEVRLYPKNAQMQTVSYAFHGGINSQVSPSNDVLRYTYDGLNRMTEVRDIDNNIKQRLDYNYGPGIAATAAPVVLYYNAPAQQNFTKQDCTTGTPTTVTYQVLYGKYTASTQAAADALAAQDIAANGQAYANANGQCLFYNTEVFRNIFKNDCPPGQGTGSRVRYVVAAGKYSAATQAAADALAQNDLNANGQAYANANGTCNCGGEGQKIVNGSCETGMKYYLTSVLQPGGQYLCTYRYQFSDGSVSQNYSELSSTPCASN